MSAIPLVYIEWCDAVANGSNPWLLKEEAIQWGENENWVIRQAGYIIKETKQYILIASKYNPQDDEDRFSELTKIPKTWIRTRQLIKLKST